MFNFVSDFQFYQLEGFGPSLRQHELVQGNFIAVKS